VAIAGFTSDQRPMAGRKFNPPTGGRASCDDGCQRTKRRVRGQSWSGGPGRLRVDPCISGTCNDTHRASNIWASEAWVRASPGFDCVWANLRPHSASPASRPLPPGTSWTEARC